MSIRVNDQNLEAVLNREQPIAEADLVRDTGYYTAWDGANFQIVEHVLDGDGNPVHQYDDDGNEHYQMVMKEQASADALNAYMVDHPYQPESAAEEEGGATEE